MPCQAFKRHHRQLRLLRTRLGRLVRDIRRKIAGWVEQSAAPQWQPAIVLNPERQFIAFHPFTRPADGAPWTAGDRGMVQRAAIVASVPCSAIFL